jgi:hypothetical protein
MPHFLQSFEGTLSEFSDFFEIHDLKRIVRVMTTAEFLQAERSSMNIPAEFTPFSVMGGANADDR